MARHLACEQALREKKISFSPSLHFFRAESLLAGYETSNLHRSWKLTCFRIRSRVLFTYKKKHVSTAKKLYTYHFHPEDTCGTSGFWCCRFTKNSDNSWLRDRGTWDTYGCIFVSNCTPSQIILRLSWLRLCAFKKDRTLRCHGIRMESSIKDPIRHNSPWLFPPFLILFLKTKKSKI